MLEEKYRKRAERATIKVLKKGGQGCLVKNAFILTAAHCIDWSCDGDMVLGVHYIEKIQTSDGRLLKVAPMAVEPILDIAVLGSLDGQVFYEDERAFEKFCRDIEPVPICRERQPLNILDTKEAELPSYKEEGEWTKKKEIVEVSQRVYIYTHKGTWLTGKTIHIFPFDRPTLILETSEQIEAGTSGAPIVNEVGEIVGIVSNASIITEASLKSNGIIPRPHLALPVWVCDEIWAKE